jgi:hypothetical protein
MNTIRQIASRLVVVAGALATFGACSHELPAPDIRPGTDAEVEHVMSALERLADAADVAGLVALFDVDAIVAASRVRGSSDLRDGFAKGLRQGLGQPSGLVERLISERKQASGWRVFPTGGAKFERRVGERWVALRLLPVDGGFEHVAFRIGSHRGKDAAIVDFQILTVGEPMSAIARTSIEEIKSHETKGSILRRLTRGLWRRDVMSEGFEAVKFMRDAVAAGDSVGALEHFAGLPSSVKTQRFVLHARMAAAQHVDEAAQLRAYEDFATYLPDDPSLLTASIDFHTLHHRFTDAIESVNRVKAITIDDAFLDVLIADLAIAAGDLDQAAAAVARATAKEADLEGLRFTQATLLVRRGDFEGAAAAFTKMSEDGIEIYVEGLAEVDGFEAFIASKPYAELLERFGDDEEEADDVDPLEGSASELVARAGIVREPGYLYFLNGAGHIERTRMVRGGEPKKPGEGTELVKALGVKRESGFLYFIDKEGHVSRTSMR